MHEKVPRFSRPFQTLLAQIRQSHLVVFDCHHKTCIHRKELNAGKSFCTLCFDWATFCEAGPIGLTGYLVRQRAADKFQGA